MALMISEEHLPATLTVPRMNDEEFLEFCSQYPDCFVEVSAEGEVSHHAAKLFANGRARIRNCFSTSSMGRK